MALMPVSEVQARIVSGIEPLALETVSIFDAAGRVLAEDLRARLTQPPFAASAMDGYAVRAADLASVPAHLKVIGKSVAGHGFNGEVGSREAVRIFTGTPVPPGADTIVIQENARAIDEAGRNFRSRGCRTTYPAMRQRFFGRRNPACGGDRAHKPTADAGRRHEPCNIPVRRRPIVAVLANGDELVEPGPHPGAGKIISSIPAGMKAAIAAWGGEPSCSISRSIARKASPRAFAMPANADILLTIGGASVGEHDLVRATLEEMGAHFRC